MKNQKLSGNRLKFQFNGIVAISPVVNVSPFGAKTSEPAKHKLMGTASKHFASSLPGVTVVSLPIPSLHSTESV